MVVRLELKPETEASLKVEAAAKGVSLDAFIQNVIEDFARVLAEPSVSVQEFRAALDRLAEMGRSLPHVPASAFSRESIYQDHN